MDHEKVQEAQSELIDQLVTADTEMEVARIDKKLEVLQKYKQ